MLSNSFEIFEQKMPEYQQIFNNFVQDWGKISVLDEKTKHLSYLAVLAATEKLDGLPFHTKLAKDAGASQKEIISAVLVGLPAVGSGVINSLPIVFNSYQELIR
ncbi:carboxymuconolactone decarboxylase family protein [Enterococcus faecium]